MRSPVRPRVGRFQPCVHGGVSLAELESLGIRSDGLLDFSSNTNPFGAAPGVKQALANLPIDRYPDPEALNIRRALAVKIGARPQNVLAGNGSLELIRLVASVYLGKGDVALVPQPAFGEYEAACRLAGARVFKLWAREEQQFRFDWTELVRSSRRRKPGLIYIGNPNNPTGQYLSREEMLALVKEASFDLMVVDEAFVNFVETSWSAVDLAKKGNVIVVRSLTKDYGLAGLRIGYAVGPESVIEHLRRRQLPWSVNIAAQEAGRIAIEDDDYLKMCCLKIKESRDFLMTEMRAMGLLPLPTEANFFLVKVGNAFEFRRHLLKKGILVRDCASFGLPEYVRLAIRSLPECRQLIKVFKESRSLV